MNKRIIFGVIGLILSIVVSIALGNLLSSMNVKLLLKKTVSVSNIVELENCNENDYIKLKVKTAYLTNFSYKDEARFVDIDVNGKALIAVVDNETSNKIENR